MNRILVASIALVAFIGVSAVAQTPPPTNTSIIKKTGHNFADMGWTVNNEICKPCHTPHHAIPASVSGSAAIWNHSLTTATYTLADGSTVNAANTQHIDKASRMCMSCHDGTVALDAFGGATTTVGVMSPSRPEMLGTDLSTNHPIGIEAKYDITGGSVSSTTGLQRFNPAPVDSGGTAKVGNVLRLQKLTHDVTTGGVTTSQTDWVVGCTTCHTAHGAAFSTAQTPIADLLRKSNKESALCLTCHVK